MRMDDTTSLTASFAPANADLDITSTVVSNIKGQGAKRSLCVKSAQFLILEISRFSNN